MPFAPQIDVIVEDPRWGDPEPIITCAVTATLAHLGLDGARFELAVLASTDARLAELNAHYRGKDKPTNVLSFPAQDLRPSDAGQKPLPLQPRLGAPVTMLGDIALAYETCAREAEAAGLPFADHLAHLVVHATLHLLGYDHETEPDAALMEGLEIAILEALGIPDPYRP